MNRCEEGRRRPQPRPPQWVPRETHCQDLTALSKYGGGTDTVGPWTLFDFALQKPQLALECSARVTASVVRGDTSVVRTNKRIKYGFAGVCLTVVWAPAG